MNNGVLDPKEVNLNPRHEYDLNGVDLNPQKNAMERGEYETLMGHFSYHKPNPNQIPVYNAINEAAKLFAKTIALNTSPGLDQELAIKKVVEAKMMANSIVATHPESY